MEPVAHVQPNTWLATDPQYRLLRRARRYYRALEFTATKRFTNNYQFIASYVYSSLIGNYEGLFRNDNGQSDPNITSLFDLVSLLDGTLRTFAERSSASVQVRRQLSHAMETSDRRFVPRQSGIPFNAADSASGLRQQRRFRRPDHVRGTAIVPTVTAIRPGFPNTVDSIGSNRTPTTINLDLDAYYPIQVW